MAKQEDPGMCTRRISKSLENGAIYPRAIRETMGETITHRTNKYLNNLLEQDHRGIKQRYYPMRGFGNFKSAARFCCAFDELRNYFRLRHTTKERVSLSEQRQAVESQLPFAPNGDYSGQKRLPGKETRKAER